MIFFKGADTHLCKIDRNTTKVPSRKTWSTWTRRSNGVQRHPAWVWVGPALGVRAKKFKIWSHGTKKIAQKILYTKLVRYHEVILWGLEAKIVFRAKQAGNIQSPDFRLSVGQKIKWILRHQKVVYVNGQVKRKLLKLFWGQKMIPLGLLGALTDP